jgi:hypothetical protein
LPPGGGLVFGPELTMLNILTGGLKLSTHAARMFALVSIQTAGRDRHLWYAQILLEYTGKNKRIGQALEELMETTFKDPFVEGWREEGRTEAASSVLFAILAARSFTVLDPFRERISTCTDPAQLEWWATRAATAKTIDEVFA